LAIKTENVQAFYRSALAVKWIWCILKMSIYAVQAHNIFFMLNTCIFIR